MFKEKPYVVLDYVPGAPVTAQWIAGHALQVGELLRLFHGDRALADALNEAGGPVTADRSVPSHLQSNLNLLDRISEHTYLKEARVRFRELSERVRPTPCVPTHGDPNCNNFLRSGRRLLLVDWDGLAVADAGRDIGPLLWWYLKPDRWNEFFIAYGSVIPAETVYFWAARASLRVALWFAERGRLSGAAQFADDFVAASRMEENPRGNWKNDRDRGAE